MNWVGSMLTSIDAGMVLEAKRKYYVLFNIYWCVRDTVIELGQICACILALYQISKGAPIGNFVMLVSYWVNFTGNPPGLVAVGSSRCLIFFRETRQFRRSSAPILSESHRC